MTVISELMLTSALTDALTNALPTRFIYHIFPAETTKDELQRVYDSLGQLSWCVTWLAGYPLG